MTTDDDAPRDGQKAPSPDDSSEILLSDLKRSISDPQMPAITDEELAAAAETRKLDEARERHDTLPPWSPDRIRREQLKAWNNMAEQMVNVVKTVKRNEARNELTLRRMRVLVFVVMLFVIGGGAVTWYQGQLITQATEHNTEALQSKLDAAAEKQDLMINAIIKLTTAHALALGAAGDFDSDKGRVAREALVDAQVAALQAQKAAAETAHDRAEVEAKIEEIEREAETEGITPDGEPTHE